MGPTSARRKAACNVWELQLLGASEEGCQSALAYLSRLKPLVCDTETVIAQHVLAEAAVNPDFAEELHTLAWHQEHHQLADLLEPVVVDALGPQAAEAYVQKLKQAV